MILIGGFTLVNLSRSESNKFISPNLIKDYLFVGFIRQNPKPLYVISKFQFPYIRKMNKNSCIESSLKNPCMVPMYSTILDKCNWDTYWYQVIEVILYGTLFLFLFLVTRE